MPMPGKKFLSRRKTVWKLWNRKVSIFLWLMIFRNIWIKTIIRCHLFLVQRAGLGMLLEIFLALCRIVKVSHSRNLWLMNWSRKCRLGIECRRRNFGVCFEEWKHNDYIKVFHFSFFSFSFVDQHFNVASLTQRFPRGNWVVTDIVIMNFRCSDFNDASHRSFWCFVCFDSAPMGRDVLTMLGTFHGKLFTLDLQLKFHGWRLLCKHRN